MLLLVCQKSWLISFCSASFLNGLTDLTEEMKTAIMEGVMADEYFGSKK